MGKNCEIDMTPQFTRRATLGACAGLLSGCLGYSTKNPDPTPTYKRPPSRVPAVIGTSKVTRKQVLRLQRMVFAEINKERKAHHSHPLKYNVSVARVARYRLNKMYREQYFAHIGPNGHAFPYSLNRFGYKCPKRGAENLIGTSYNPSNSLSSLARSMVKSWMSSAPHRRSLLNDTYKITGVGVLMYEKNGHLDTTSSEIFCQELTQFQPKYS